MSGEARLALTGASRRAQKVAALLLFLALIGLSMVFARVATIEMSMLAQFFALLLAGAACIYFSHSCMLSKREYVELLILALFGLLFTGTAVLCNGERVYERIALAWGLLSLVVTVLSAHGLQVNSSKPSGASIVAWLKVRWPVMIIAAIYVVAYIPNFDLWVKGDSATYYRLMRELPNWNLSFDSTLGYAQLGGHYAYGFAVLNYPISLLFGGSLFGLRFGHLVMSCLAITMIPALLRKLFPTLREVYVYGCTALLAFSPLVFGLSAEFTVDAYSLYLLVLISFFHISRARILLGAACLAFIFTKEVNAIVLCLYAVFALAYEIRKSSVSEFVHNGGLADALMFLIAGGFFVLVAYMQKSSAWTTSQYVSGMNGLGINGLYIVTKVKEMLFMNGHWLLLAISVLTVAVWGRHGVTGSRLHLDNEGYVEIGRGACRAGMAGAFVGFVLYSLFFVTYVTYRYIQPLILFLVIGIAAICSRSRRSRCMDCLLMGAFVFYVGCNFFTDPVTQLLFKNLDAGNGRVITTRTFIEVNNEASTNERDLKNYLISNAVVYNRQYLGIERCIESLIADVDNGDMITVLVPAVFGDQTIRSTFGSALDTETYYWDAKTGNIVVDAEGQGLPELHLVEFDKGEKPPITSMEDTYVLIMPFEDVSGYLECFDVVDTVYESSGVWRFGLAKVSGER
ncbi:hypothetical protein [Olsenella sp. An270]|uniref:hypothetical protein n=1 Tax=Olsenella sp. An270 TaxID=1965615 RepID=UPI00117DB34D|nr:hypothetical protein [Olsenella sp. An270]